MSKSCRKLLRFLEIPKIHDHSHTSACSRQLSCRRSTIGTQPSWWGVVTPKMRFIGSFGFSLLYILIASVNFIITWCSGYKDFSCYGHDPCLRIMVVWCGQAMIRFDPIPYLLCASVVGFRTVGLIIANISNKTTEAQRHGDNRNNYITHTR